ncbi:TonB-dependent vitamin B12 receptor [Imhoffiella purpurea]|uniref:Outer membrane vitamin B12 receptor BtuB n=1 Tax=Imhoffiella purpurea TaxID=1249627 RepID=W9V437_9GAMM|nr:TonB-dependent vitamin B12 receptor [Imhoffiella purpurea]EXJ14288.1 Outer membrane vitamin B12 receptor BtuB [Imhoffiella purpurea]
MKHPLTLAALTLPLAGNLFADTSPTTLDTVVVTATRTATPATESLASVTVIDRAEIERRQSRSVPDLLRGVPGVTVSQNGGAGQVASVSLRGTNSDHVLVLIDGVRIGSATLGTSPLQDIPIEQIERIEVVRGPRSSLYGSEAIGGVIQIFTRRGGGPLAPRLSVGGGSFGTLSASAGLSGGGENGWFDLGANVERTDGIDACDGRPAPYAGCGVFQNDRDGYRNIGVNVRGGYRFSDWASLDLHLLSSQNRTEFDGTIYGGNRSRSEQQVLGGTLTLQPLSPWTLTLSAGHSWDKYRVYFDDEAAGIDDRFIDSFETERDTFSLQNDLNLAPGQMLTLGLDYTRDSVSGTVDYDKDSRDDVGVFGEYQGAFGPTSLTLSLRQDDDEQFGTHATGSAALGYLFANGIQVSASYGTAFKAPAFNDLYYPNYGNPDLDPEQSHSLELGLRGELPLGTIGQGDWELSLYQTDIDDLIAYDSTSYSAANIQSARILGLEASANARILGWDLGSTLTLLDPENDSDDANDGNLLPRRAEQTFQLDLDRAFDRWSFGATLFVSGRRFDDLANSERLAGYSLVDLRAEYAIDASLRLQARLENAFDEDYETAYLYNRPGRAFYLTLRYEPELP